MGARRSTELVCVGVISGAFGVDGQVKIKSFTAVPEDIGAYGALVTEDRNASFTLKVNRTIKEGVTGYLSGITDREQANALRGIKLFVSRDALPELAADTAKIDAQEQGEQEYYHADLVGLTVRWLDQPRSNGTVKAVFDFGAGDLLEIIWPVAQNSDEMHSILLPFDRESVPEIRLAEGYITAMPPVGLMPKPAAKKRRHKARKRKENDRDSGK
ncbi:MAG TPA: 16S rRNA processing protein RimM [Alphaproteobacteria bacterium]|nr:16S rRNA processing protein RimM [Alphaproteobacteria bacterium]HBF99484.1 16S rRNA processing protein RimM [Alphaproteobacteria bacterium]